ncbi:nucleoside-diphosphate-sugar epimerase [Methanocalculus sp. AMF5]|uniref:hypothetical protein n=1 Tax=Methanocalculus sp. AMF5 TaxID=1198257 RepID=UPI00209E6773|nr:hypothetical protein [Methanocalculus sp. AMF5]MCP1663259.1 nucleoside-diphosphate-sugar epimerase [Methanocalculus sp. AMF5]
MNILIFGTGWIVNAKEQKGDVQDTWADAGKAERGLRWSAKVRIQEGLERYVGWIDG